MSADQGAPGPSAPAAGTAPAAEAAPGTTGKPAAQSQSYEQLYEQIKSKPCKVARIERLYEEKGREIRTKPHIIDRELEQVERASTLEEIHTALEKAGSALSDLDIFRSVDILITEEPEVRRRTEAVNPSGTDNR